ISILLFSLHFTSTVSGQSGVIKGRIFDSNSKEPLTGATVIVKGVSTGAMADAKGIFIIQNIPADTYQLTGSYLSYESLTKENVVVRAGDTTEIELALTPESISLDAVEIVARVNREAENVLLAEQRRSLTGTQMVGARELSRKGISDAE